MKTNKNYGIRILASIIGTALLALGIGFANVAGMGVDAYTSANLGISGLLGMELGTYMLALNIVIGIIVFILDRKMIGFGTIFNIVFCGYMIQFFSSTLGSLLPDPNLIVRSIFLILGTIVFSFGISLYLNSDMGVAPYDAITPLIVDRIHKPFKYVRIVQDVAFVLIGVVSGGPFGVGTFVMAFLVGPILDFFNNNVTNKMFERMIPAEANGSVITENKAK